MNKSVHRHFKTLLTLMIIIWQLTIKYFFIMADNNFIFDIFSGSKMFLSFTFTSFFKKIYAPIWLIFVSKNNSDVFIRISWKTFHNNVVSGVSMHTYLKCDVQNTEYLWVIKQKWQKATPFPSQKTLLEANSLRK